MAVLPVATRVRSARASVSLAMTQTRSSSKEARDLAGPGRCARGVPGRPCPRSRARVAPLRFLGFLGGACTRRVSPLQHRLTQSAVRDRQYSALGARRPKAGARHGQGRAVLASAATLWRRTGALSDKGCPTRSWHPALATLRAVQAHGLMSRPVRNETADERGVT